MLLSELEYGLCRNHVSSVGSDEAENLIAWLANVQLPRNGDGGDGDTCLEIRQLINPISSRSDPLNSDRL